MAIYLGIDCGATHLRVGLVTEEGELLDRKVIGSPLKTESDKLAEKVKIMVNGAKFEAIGIGTPGPLDLKQGLILPSSNLGNVAPINLKTQFDKVLDSKIYLDRDTVVGLIGEIWKGGGVGCKDVIMLTLGTGVGGAIMEGGEIERGADGRAGEIGHMYIQFSNTNLQFNNQFTMNHLNNENSLKTENSKIGNLPKCGLGHEGCFEALINSADDLDEIGMILGYALANIVDIFNPEKILIGGGKTKMGDFLPKAVEVMKEVGMKPAVDSVLVEYAKLGDMAGVFGAAKLAMEGQNDSN